MADNDAKDGDGKDGESPPSKNKLLTILVLVNIIVVLAGAGGTIAFIALNPSNPSAQAEEEEPPAPREMGPLLEVQAMVVNLDDPTGSHFIRAGFQFELTSAEAQPDVEARMVPIRSGILLYLSSLSVDDTVGREAREGLLEHLLETTNEQIGSELVRAVYFTEFVVQ